MELKSILIGILVVGVVKSVPIDEVKPNFQRVLKFQNNKVEIQNDEQLFYGVNKEFGNTESLAADDLNYRLPNNSIPIRYDLWLKTDVDKKLSPFNGNVKIHIKVLQATQEITLHQRQLKIDSIDLYGTDKVLVQPNLASNYLATLEFLTIALPRMMAINEEFILDISYHGLLREDSSGFYRSRYFRDDDPNQLVWFAMTQFEQTDARHAMPCYDEPGIRAVFNVQIQHDKSFHALSNMPIKELETVPGTDYVTTKFEDSVPMQTYLLAFIVSDFDYISSNEVGLPQRIFAKPQSIARGDGNYAATVVGPVLNALEAQFGIKYPLPKMDHVAVTDYIWGAMEHYGLITYLEPRLLYNPVTGPNEANRKTTNEIIAHEYTHQYFGNLVNPKWWAYTWLNEGFATFFQYYILDKIYPNEDYMDRLQNNAVERAFTADASPSAWTLNQYVEKPADINSKFGTVSYQKGGSVIRMFQEALGDATFMKGLSYYLNDMYFQAATPQDLHRNLQIALDEAKPGNGVNLDQIMSTWEDQAGYPVLQVTKVDGNFVITQQRYGGGNEIYAIPLTYTTSVSPNFIDKTPKEWMQVKTYRVTGPADWIILNIQQKGYFEVRYEKAIWEEFFKALKNNVNVIHPVHRRQFFRDTTKSIEESLVPDYFGLKLMEYLNKEMDLKVWDKVTAMENFFNSKLFGTELLPKYQKFLQSLVETQLTSLGFDGRVGESIEDANLRERMISTSCKAFNEDCLNYELNRLKRFVSTNTGSYNLCNGLRLADSALFQTIVDSFLTEAAKTTRGQNLYMPGCSLNSELLKKFLQLSLDATNNLSANEKLAIITNTVTKSTAALEEVIEFVRVNYVKINEMFPESLTGILNMMTTNIQSEKHFTSYKQVLKLCLDAEIINQVDVNTFEFLVNDRMRWHVQNMESIRQVLNGEIPNEPTDLPPTAAPTTPAPTTPAPTTPAPTTPAPTTLAPTTPAPATPAPTTPMSTSTTTLGASTTIVSLTTIILCALVKLFA